MSHPDISPDLTGLEGDMATGIGELELVQDGKPGCPNTSFSATTHITSPTGDPHIMTSEARGLFVRFAIRWGQNRLEQKQAQQGVA